MPKKINKEEEKNIVNFYKDSPKTFNDVAEHFNISSPTVGKILKRYNIKKYTKTQLFSPKLKENYFEKITTPNQAYFLGLIISDGCVWSSKGKTPLLGLTIQDKDSYILKDFLQEICSNKKITSDGRGCQGVQIVSAKMVSDLNKYGIFENKSLNTIFPTNLEKRLYPHLLRGLIDGDGSISFYSRKDRNVHTKAIRMCQGNEQFLKDMIDFIYKEYQIEKVSIFREKENLWSFAYRKNKSLNKLINILYEDAEFYLHRKKEKCDLILAENAGNTEITNSSK